MWKKLLLGLGPPALALAVFGFVQETDRAPEAKVLCCGQCKPGDDCVAKCEVVGRVPEGTSVTCCGNCRKGDDCLSTCAPRKRSCCEAR